ncbi:MAG: type II secretion system F family protein [Planctomycetales bacterium]|nr:type II secretion system F family protein [Planctomycetales bacterium]MCA9166869.1 type II secretion system F family protein [Planctomycetales bacterium]
MLLMDMMSTRKTRAVERLGELKDPRKRLLEKTVGGKKNDTMAKVLEKASPTLAKPLQPKSEKEQGLLKQRLDHAGFRGETAPGMFLSAKFAGLIIGFTVAGGSVLFTGFNQGALIRMVLLSGGMFYMPDLAVWWMARRRKQAIFLSLPDALDLMVVCVEAGLGLDQAMRKVAEEMKKSHRVIAEEFSICNFQLQMGKTRRDVLQNLGSRTGVDDLRALAAVLIQAEKFGASVGQALRVQSDSMRTRRRQLAEEKAAKTAVQLIFPLVLFIFPGIFVVLVGPAAITMVRQMFPAMNGG